jgi:hypothetical protein
MQRLHDADPRHHRRSVILVSITALAHILQGVSLHKALRRKVSMVVIIAS